MQYIVVTGNTLIKLLYCFYYRHLIAFKFILFLISGRGGGDVVHRISFNFDIFVKFYVLILQEGGS